MKLDILKYLNLLKDSFDSSEIVISKNGAATLIIRICVYARGKLRNNQFAINKNELNSSFDKIDFSFNKAINEIKDEIKEDMNMRSVATIEYKPSETTKEEAMLKVEHKAFSQIIEKIRGKEFKYLKISTDVINLFDYGDLAKAKCSIYLEE